MGKVIKILLSLLSALLLTLIVLPIVVSLLLNIPAVQQRVGRELTGLLSRKLETTVTLDRLSLRLFNRVTLDGLYVQDYHGDTLFYAQQVIVPVAHLNPFSGDIALGQVELNTPSFYLMQDSTGTTNLRQLLQKFKEKEKKPSTKPFSIQAAAVHIKNMHFKHLKKERIDRPYGVNFTDLDVSDFNLRVRQVSVVDDSIRVAIDSLRLRSKSGLRIDNVSTNEFIISGSTMRFDRLRIDTPDSHVRMNYLHFDYGTWQGYSDFLSRVRMQGEINDSRVSFRTIAYFAPSLREWNATFDHVSGVVSGPVAAMQGELTRVETLGTRLNAQFDIQGLPNIQNTRFNVNVRELTTSEADVNQLLTQIGKPGLNKATSNLLKKLEPIRFGGNFDGLLSDFIADGKLHSTLGELALKLNFRPLPKQQTAFTGRLQTAHFELGKLLNIPKLERISVLANVTGRYGNHTIAVDTKATIPTLTYNHYAYDTIQVNGTFENRKFDGTIHSGDANLNFDFDGSLDYNDSLPQYNFGMKLYNADLNALGVNHRDSVSTLRGRFVAQASGTSLDNINGQATISQMTYTNHLDTVSSGDIRLVAENSADRKLLGMYSSFADVELKGKLSYNNLVSYFKNTLRSYLPSIAGVSEESKESEKQKHLPKPPQAAPLTPNPSATADANSYYLINMNIKQANNVAGIFLPGLELAQGTKLSFLFNPLSDLFSLTLTSEYIVREESFVSNLNLNSRNQGDSISLFIRADDLYVGGVYMPNFSIIGGAKENQINLATRFSNTENGTYAMLSTTSTLSMNPQRGIPQIKVRFHPSTISSRTQSWRVWADSIVYDTTQLAVHKFSISSGQQRLAINGVASHSTQDSLSLSLDNFDLSPLSHLTDRMGYSVKGITNGNAQMNAVMGGGVLTAGIDLDSVQVNGIDLRDTHFESRWDFQTQRAQVRLTDKRHGGMIINGYYRPADKRYMADFYLNKIPLALLDPVLTGVIGQTEGVANAELKLTNPHNTPLLNGTIQVDTLATRVLYTNVPYHIGKSTIQVKDNVMTLQPTSIYDPAGNSAALEMDFNFNNPRNLTYNLQVKPNNLQVLGTTLAENDLFYGNVYATGAATIRGTKNAVNMDIVATTTGNSEFYMPLSGNRTISRADFVVFEDPRQGQQTDSLSMMSRRKQILLGQRKKRQANPTNMNINMLITATPSAQMQLVIDPTVGDIIKGRGNGTLNIHVNPANEVFTIYGDYDITEGSYKFTLRNIATRNFTLEPGSSIQWTGDPIDATLNMTAVYKLKASLAPLLGTADRSSTPVDCLIKLTDKLTDPTITFDVQVPNSTPETQSLVAHAINSQEAMATQFLWLLAAKSFYSDNTAGGQNLNIGAVGATVTGIDFLTNQLSSLMTTDRFSFVPKYSPKSELTSDEVGGSLYGELIKDRLILEADVSYDTRNNNISMGNRSVSNVTGDATLSLLLDHTGNFRMQAFTRTIDRFDENLGLQESGIGIFYRENFNNFKDLVSIFKERFARLGKKKSDKKGKE